MATVYTTTSTTALQYPSTTYMDRMRGGGTDDGDLYVMGKDSTANQYTLYRSTNDGTSWSAMESFTRTGLVEMGSIFVGRDGWVRLVYRVNESSLDKIYIRGLNTDGSDWETELLLSSVGNGGVAGAIYQGIDLWQTVAGGVEYYCVAVGYTSGATHGVRLLGAYTRPIPGTTVADNTVIHGTRQWLFTGSGRITPCIDAQHSGDGKTTTNPHLWVSFGRTSSYVVKVAWNGDGWTGPTSAVTLATGFSAMDSITGRWDGTRFIVATRSTTDATRVILRERNQGNTTTTTRTSPAHSQGNIRPMSFNYNSTTGDVRVYAVGTTVNDLYYCDYFRTLNTWGSWTVVTTTDILGTNVDNWGTRRSTYGFAKYDVVTQAVTTGVVTHTAQVFGSYTPLPGTWNFTGLSHVNGGARLHSSTLPINWVFVDTDPGSTQTAFAIRRDVGGTLRYWRESDDTWQTSEVKNVLSNNSLTVPAPWATGATEVTHVYHLKTWNTADQTSGYTGEAFLLTPSVAVDPVLTAPAAGTYTTDNVTATWTCTDQSAYKVRLDFSPSGAVYDSGKVADAVARSHVIPIVLADSTSYIVKLETWNAEGLISAVQQVTINVDFIEPATPTLVCTPSSANGWIAVVITNPAPGGGQPAVDRQDLYRRETAVGGDGTRIAADLATGATHNDWRAVDDIAYDYRVQVFGVNGANVYSAWTT